MEKDYIPLRKLLSESLIRDLVLFSLLFLLTISQIWVNILLLLFPLIIFAFSLYFHMISANKWRLKFNDNPIAYYPLGIEKKHANRFGFCAIILIILLFWIGAESLYHPQLIDNYTIPFLIIFVFFYTFGFYWIFIDLWKYSRIEVILDGIDINELEKTNKKVGEDIQNVVSFLKLKSFSKISLISFIVFFVLNGLNAISIILSTFNILPALDFQYTLPGTGIEGSEPITLSPFLYVILIYPPVITIFLLIFTYNDVNSINQERLNMLLKSSPQHIKIHVIENLKAINKKLREDLKLE